MGAAGRQHGAVGFKVSAAYHDDTVAKLTVDALIVQLLEDLLKMAWEIHGPADRGAEGRLVMQNYSQLAKIR